MSRPGPGADPRTDSQAPRAGDPGPGARAGTGERDPRTRPGEDARDPGARPRAEELWAELRAGVRSGARAVQSGARADVRYAEFARERLAALPPPADAEAFALAYNLLQLAYLLVTDLETRIHRPRGWTLPGFRLMFKLWLLGPAQPARLAEISAMSRSAVTNAVNTLERDGLVERRRVPEDGRAVEVVLTVAGEAAVREAFAEQTRREQEWFAPLEAAEREHLTGLLTRILAARPPGTP
ncbi:MarR family winged helix-turn-helix transcriptional regulator [Planomonospora corallina]|uniref:MarR family winged helix-turn-helix transcriptional regulator n=1 Tax=Planomonospora corallina TaxID=1806052 RepID=A0ABV8I2D5_9ACTN